MVLGTILSETTAFGHRVTQPFRGATHRKALPASPGVGSSNSRRRKQKTIRSGYCCVSHTGRRLADGFVTLTRNKAASRLPCRFAAAHGPKPNRNARSGSVTFPCLTFHFSATRLQLAVVSLGVWWIRHWRSLCSQAWHGSWAERESDLSRPLAAGSGPWAGPSLSRLPCRLGDFRPTSEIECPVPAHQIWLGMGHGLIRNRFSLIAQ